MAVHQARGSVPVHGSFRVRRARCSGMGIKISARAGRLARCALPTGPGNRCGSRPRPASRALITALERSVVPSGPGPRVPEGLSRCSWLKNSGAEDLGEVPAASAGHDLDRARGDRLAGPEAGSGGVEHGEMVPWPRRRSRPRRTLIFSPTVVQDWGLECGVRSHGREGGQQRAQRRAGDRRHASGERAGSGAARRSGKRSAW